MDFQFPENNNTKYFSHHALVQYVAPRSYLYTADARLCYHNAVTSWITRAEHKKCPSHLKMRL